MNVLGLDLSLTSSGYSCGPEVGTITVKTKGPERLIQIREAITNLCAALNPDLVVVEGYSFASRNSQAHSIGELGGVIRVALHEAGCPTAIVPPTCRAKFASGRGNSSKVAVVSAISARTGIAWEGKGADDMCDAWILEEMGLTYLGLGKHAWPEKNLEALTTIDWPEGLT